MYEKLNTNKKLNRARSKRDDEFYTLYSDAVEELSRYDLSSKVVYCPCDSKDSQIYQCLEKMDCRVHRSSLSEGISFMSDEALKRMSLSDVIITNPPFSLFREFYKFIRNTDFVIVAPVNALKYKIVFEDIKAGRVVVSGKRLKGFIRPDGSILNTPSVWLTTLKDEALRKRVVPDRHIDPRYRYDNYDAWEVSRVKNIPACFSGKLGVPISYLEHHNEELYEILDNRGDLRLKDKNVYQRIIIQARRK